MLPVRLLLIGAVLLLAVAAPALSTPDGSLLVHERWCGGESAASDRPDTVGGPQVHVVYAVPSDQPSNFASRASGIVTDLAAVDRWWRREDSAHTLRFDLAGFEGCDSELGRLDLSEVRLPHDSSVYRDAPYRPIFDDLAAEPFGFDVHRSDEIYLVYFDGPVNERAHCGVGTVLYLQTPFVDCSDDLGDANYKASTAAHELMHALGTVNSQAPHHCGASHVCDSVDDLMYDVYNPGLRRAVLDYGHDDYYGHSGSWPDAQDSQFLRRLDQPARPVVVTLAGSGTGRVVSKPVGLSCPPACSSTWDTGAQLQLSPEAPERNRFVGWGGACSADDECSLVVDGPENVTATFAALVKLKLHVVAKERGAGGFIVDESAGIDCPDDCEEDVDKGRRSPSQSLPSAARASSAGRARAERAASVGSPRMRTPSSRRTSASRAIGSWRG